MSTEPSRVIDYNSCGLNAFSPFIRSCDLRAFNACQLIRRNPPVYACDVRVFVCVRQPCTSNQYISTVIYPGNYFGAVIEHSAIDISAANNLRSRCGKTCQRRDITAIFPFAATRSRPVNYEISVNLPPSQSRPLDARRVY